jgi:putative transposase
VPTYSVSKLVTIIESLTAREIFRRCPEVKKQLWGGEFWTDGYFASTVGRHGNEKVIAAYVKRQGSGYRKLVWGFRCQVFIIGTPVRCVAPRSAAER